MGLIVGITGTLGAGKGTVAEFLMKKGFKHYSVRDFLSEKIRERNLPDNRDSLVKVANELRKQHGPSYIAEVLFERARRQGGDAIIESIRTEGEVKSLQENGNFYLFAVDANPELRYERIKQRKTSTDMISYDKFIEQENREMTSTDPTKQNLKRCRELADFTLKNEGSIEDLHQQVEEILHEIR
ncbi:MAG: AAA family ATPase [Nanoarchaeota archaeon]